MSSPINALIDKACGYKPKATVRSSKLVLLRCPSCKRKRLTEREQGEPKRTATIILRCPDCDKKHGFMWPLFLDKNGKDLFP